MTFTDRLLLVLDLAGAHHILLNEFSIGLQVCPPLVASIVLVIVDELLGSFAELTLLVFVILEGILILHTFLGHSLKHIVTFTHAIAPFHISLLLFELNGIGKIIAILPSVCLLRKLFVLLFTLMGFSLALDDSTPLVEISSGIDWVVSLTTILERL